MDNKVIEVLDYLGQKLGIAIDWTAENVWPQVMDFLNRYRMYAIVCDGMWILIGLAVIFAFIYLFKKIIKQRKAKDGIFWLEDELVVVAVVIGVIALIAFAVVILANIFAIAQWITVPEIKFFETFKAYLQ